MGIVNAVMTPQGQEDQHAQEDVADPVNLYADRSAYFPEWLGRWPASL
jgi:hypothetical protein